MAVEGGLLNRKTRRELQRKARGKTNLEKFMMCQEMAHNIIGPLTEDEKALSDEFLKRTDPSAWYHGGLAGRQPGDVLVPAGQTGIDARGVGPKKTNRLRAFSFTSEIPAARVYASMVKNAPSSVYRVEPIGPIEVDTSSLRAVTLMSMFIPIRQDGKLVAELPVKGFCAPTARVLEMIESR